MPEKKKSEKWPFLDQNHGLTPLEKCQFFFNCRTSCFYSLQRRFFVLEYRKNTFPGLYCLKRKVGKMAIFGPNHGLNPFEKYQFLDFLNLLFLYPRKVCNLSKIS